MEQLLKICRYYKGETECPEILVQKNKDLLWYYEKLWVERDEFRDEANYNTIEYFHYGMKDFNIEDGIPVTLKALLFNKYIHWFGGYCMENDTKNFKEWYWGFYYESSE